MLPRLLIKELFVLFDCAADVSAMPSAGSSEAFRLGHAGGSGQFCWHGQLCKAHLTRQSTSVRPLELWALDCGRFLSALISPTALHAATSPGTTELHQSASIEPGFWAALHFSSLLFITFGPEQEYK